MAAEDSLFWPSIRLNLHGAILDSWYFVGCRIQWGNFSRVRFLGEGWFSNSEFTEHAIFDGALSTRKALFAGAKFGGIASFREAKIIGEAIFSGATFDEKAWFMDCSLSGGSKFDGIVIREDGGGEYLWPSEWRKADFIGKGSRGR